MKGYKDPLQTTCMFAWLPGYSFCNNQLIGKYISWKSERWLSLFSFSGPCNANQVSLFLW